MGLSSVVVTGGTGGRRAGFRQTDEQQEGQVSETVRLDPEEAETPIADGEHVAGYPESESGEPDEGHEIGPDADQFRERDVR